MNFFKKTFPAFVFVLIASYFLLPAVANSQLSEQQIREQEARWRAELQKTEEEIVQWELVLNQTKKGTASLTRDANILQAKINEARAFIRQRQVQIKRLTRDIGLKTKTIKELEQKMKRGKESLASMIRDTNLMDNFSLAEAVLSSENLSDFFGDVYAYTAINKSLEKQFQEIRSLQIKTSSERKILGQKRNQEADTKARIESDKRKIERDESEKQRLININKNQEKTYEQVIKEKQQRAAQIRAALFALRDTKGIPFGDALKYAQTAESQTGVRSALILAVLTQESNLGKNLGSCLISNINTGDGSGKNTGTFFQKVMKAPRDTVPFKRITKRLGRDWSMTPVSCPPGKKWTATRGYGGGMGPSQFIPSTWELFKKNIGEVLGISPDSADPWNPTHSFMATAIYLRDLGAGGGGYTAERNAACRYYSGRKCDNRAPRNTFYGNQVVAKADNIQLNMIDPLEGF